METAVADVPRKKIAAVRREAMRVPLLIEHIDGLNSPNVPNELERVAIQSSACINCHESYNSSVPIMFVITMQGIIWWHRHRCAFDIS